MNINPIKKEPIVYIILPVYNGGDYFVQQLYTIKNQIYDNRHLIIINDGSTDNTMNLINDFVEHYELKGKVTIIYQNNTGQYAACGVGLQKAKELCKGNYEGKYIAYCDADDLWTNNKLQDQINYMINNPGCDLSYHDCWLINKNDQIIGSSSLKYFATIGKKINSTRFFEICMGQCMISTTMIFKAKWINNILPVSPSFSQDWWVSLILSGNNAKIKIINNKYGYYRIHRMSSLQTKKKSQSYLNWLENYYKTLIFIKGRIKKPNEKILGYFINYINRRIDLHKKTFFILHINDVFNKISKYYFIGFFCVLFFMILC